MNIKGQSICNHPAIIVRNALRSAGGRGQAFTEGHFYRALKFKDNPGITHTEDQMEELFNFRFNSSIAMIKYLAESKFIEEINENPKDSETTFLNKQWVMTLKGSGFANASARKPHRKSKAIMQLYSLLTRALRSIVEKQHLLIVDELVLFGSLLDKSKTEVSDIDLAVRLIECPHEDRDEYFRQLSDRAKMLGAEDYGSAYHAMIACTNEVYKYLKNRQPIFSIHSLDTETVLKKDIPRMTLFKYEPFEIVSEDQLVSLIE